MELIIHDLDDEKLENLKWKIEKKEKIMDKIKESINQKKIIDDEDISIICDNNRIKSCMGCFECWIKTPGKCKIRDGYENLAKLYSKADKVVIISQCVYGSYSPFVKNVLDRTIPYLLPFFKFKNKFANFYLVKFITEQINYNFIFSYFSYFSFLKIQKHFFSFRFFLYLYFY